jgi:hypothetical protein
LHVDWAAIPDAARGEHLRKGKNISYSDEVNRGTENDVLHAEIAVEVAEVKCEHVADHVSLSRVVLVDDGLTAVLGRMEWR